MSLKKEKIISVIAIFLISSLVHFTYNLIPMNIVSYFFPVNESIFEHLKMIMTTYFIWGIIEYFILKNIKHNNFCLSTLISSLICIIFILLVFSPIYLILMNKKENMIVTLIIYFIGIVISQFISYKILKSKTNYKKLNYLSILVYIVIMFIFAYLTHNPIHNDIFFDFEKKKYGI